MSKAADDVPEPLVALPAMKVLFFLGHTSLIHA